MSIKKSLITSVSTIAATFTLATPAFAGSLSGICPTNGTGSTTLSALCQKDPGTIIGSVITFIFVLAGILSLIFLVWGGIRWVTSQGEKSNVEGARNQIVAAVIGLIFVFLSYALVNLALNFFTGTNLSNLNIPNIGQ